MECPICHGEGYKKVTKVEVGYGASVVKEWCEICRGRGEIPYAGDRTQNIAWERE